MSDEMKGSGGRRVEIIELARKSFFERGYSGTSVQSLIDDLGIAKGTFYHYFQSKEELLDAVVLGMVEGVLGEVRKKVETVKGTAPEKLELFFREMAAWKLSHKGFMLELMEVLYRPENLLLRARMQSHGVTEMIPILTGIVSDGIREGSFDVEDPEEAVEMLLALFAGLGGRLAPLMMEASRNPEAVKRVNRRLDACQEAMNRVLGARERISVFTPEMMEAWFGR